MTRPTSQQITDGVICAWTRCDNPVDTVRVDARYCSRACQIAAYRRQHTRRTYIVLTLDEHRQLDDLARASGTTIDEIAAELVREGLNQ